MITRRKKTQQRGSGLIAAILVTLIITAVAGGLLMMSSTNHLISSNERDAERALFASKAGLNYGYMLFSQGAIFPSAAGTSFDSYTPAVSTPLDGEAFAGKLYDMSATMAQGQLFRIESTGIFNRARRTTELVFQNVPEASKYGYVGYSAVTLHNHSKLAGPAFRIRSTIFSNGNVDVPEGLTVDGSIVSAGEVSLDTGSTLTGSVFANELTNEGTINGRVRTLTSVIPTIATATVFNRVDNMGNKYNWYNNKSTAGTVTNSGMIAGGTSSYAIQNNDEFRYSVFTRDGTLLLNPDLNVVRYAAPPLLDYQAMQAEALKNEMTYFTSMTAAMQYLITKKVVEVVDGKTVTTIRVGTPSAPEFIYVSGPFTLNLNPDVANDSPSTGTLKAHGFHLEGGIYTSNSFTFNGPDNWQFRSGYPNGYYEININALPYCYPAIISYSQPAAGTIATWTPRDTPPMNGAAGAITFSSGAAEGFCYLNGVTYSQGETHMHHTESTVELIRFNGAEMGWVLHNCDYFDFTYDPASVCTRFLVGEGVPKVVSYRELR